MRCVILDDYQNVAQTYAAWDSLDDIEVTSLTEHLGPDALVRVLKGAEIVVAMRERTPFPADVLERLPALKLLVTTGMRNASIDLAAASRLGITVCGTPSSPHPPVELTWALIHTLTRHIVTEATGHAWQRTVGSDLHGRTLGLLGLGKIGTRVAAVGQAFGMDVIAWSPHLTAERAEPLGVRAVDKATLFETSDIVSLHLVLSETTRHIVGGADLARMKPTAHLVNTSRSGLIDTQALVAHLGSGTIAGAGLDVYDVEPLPVDDVLRHLPNVVATPHLGYVTDDNYRRFYGGAVEDVAAWLAGDPIRTLLPKDPDA